MENISKSKGYACYFHVRAPGEWTNSSRVNIYPSKINNIKVYMANGTSRKDAKTEYNDVKTDKEYSFEPNQNIYLMVVPSPVDTKDQDENNFEFTYSITGEIDTQTDLWAYFTTNERGYIYVAAGVAGLALLVCCCCLARYYGRRQALRANRNVAIERMEKEAQ